MRKKQETIVGRHWMIRQPGGQWLRVCGAVLYPRQRHLDGASARAALCAESRPRPAPERLAAWCCADSGSVDAPVVAVALEPLAHEVELLLDHLNSRLTALNALQTV